MVSKLNLAFIGFLIFLSCQTILASPMARIDRSVIALDDTLTLTIRVNDTGSISAPNLSPLATDFHVLGNSQSSRHTLRNGVTESWTEWTITLMPKRKGQLTIPALAVNGDFSQPLNINVQPKVPVSADNLQPVYLESEVDWDSVYVQQQIIYTLRIFQSIQLDNMNISEPAFDNANVEKISQNSFQRRVHNTPYRVHELRYAIFPQQTGELVIPALAFSATETLNTRSAFNLSRQGRIIKKLSQQHTVIVKTPPTLTDANNWLPAKSLTLTENWSGDINALRVGDSLTRTITINAEGLLGSQLPPIIFEAIKGAKLYPDKDSSETSNSDQGVISQRTNSVALIPTTEGEITLPAITVRWWDTKLQRVKEATIQERSLTVKAALAGSTTNGTPLAVNHSQSDSPETSPTIMVQNKVNTLWQVISALLAIGWFITLYLWWRASKTPAQIVDKPEDSNAQLSEKKAFKQLSQACKHNEPQPIRAALIVWANSYWSEHSIQSLQDIQQCCPQENLQACLIALDKILYANHSNHSWRGESLLTIIAELRKNQDENKNVNKQLKPLYQA